MPSRPFLVAIVLTSSSVEAQPTTANDYFLEGETAYNLNDLPRAIEAFKKGFALETTARNRAAYIYNIAQAYRHLGDCTQQVFFYKRYLSLRDEDPHKPLDAEKRAEIETWIASGKECIEKQAHLRSKEPDGPVKREAEVDPEPRIEPTVAVGETRERSPSAIELRAAIGGVKVGLGTFDVPIQPIVDASGGYTLLVRDAFAFDAGAGVSVVPIPFDEMGGHATGWLVRPTLRASIHVRIAHAVRARAQVGIGALVFANVGGSGFTNGRSTTGPLGTAHLHAEIGVDYELSTRWFVSLAPFRVAYSPSIAGLHDSIGSITSLEMSIGIGYTR